MCDNHTAIRLLHKPIHDLRIRHVDILYNLILQYKTLMKLVSTTAHQLSDIFTIPLPDDKYIFPGPQIGISDSLTKEQNLILFKILYYLIFFFRLAGEGRPVFANERSNYNSDTKSNLVCLSIKTILLYCFLKKKRSLFELLLFSLSFLTCCPALC